MRDRYGAEIKMFSATGKGSRELLRLSQSGFISRASKQTPPPL